jgi:hypothetical protein
VNVCVILNMMYQVEGGLNMYYNMPARSLSYMKQCVPHTKVVFFCFMVISSVIGVLCRKVTAIAFIATE